MRYRCAGTCNSQAPSGLFPAPHLQECVPAFRVDKTSLHSTAGAMCCLQELDASLRPVNTRRIELQLQLMLMDVLTVF